MNEITGGSPYGASTGAEDGNGSDRQPSATGIDGARFQGRRVAEVIATIVLVVDNYYSRSND